MDGADGSAPDAPPWADATAAGAPPFEPSGWRLLEATYGWVEDHRGPLPDGEAWDLDPSAVAAALAAELEASPTPSAAAAELAADVAEDYRARR